MIYIIIFFKVKLHAYFDILSFWKKSWRRFPDGYTHTHTHTHKCINERISVKLKKKNSIKNQVCRYDNNKFS